jgi:acyl carrier protein
MTREDFEAALKPKVTASWNLHSLLPQDMDFFILLSSGSGIVGNPGQSNYSAGNTYQDALARYRTTKGLKATALDLGMILSVGFIAEKPEVIRSIRQQGYNAIREEEFLALLDELCDPSLSVPSHLKSQISLGLGVPELLRSKGMEEPAWMSDPMFRYLRQIGTGSKTVEGATHTLNYRSLLAGADSRNAAEGTVTGIIIQQLAKVLGIDVKTISATEPLHTYGVDSLVAVELRAWLLKELSAQVAVFDIIGDNTIRALGRVVTRKSALVQFANEED